MPYICIMTNPAYEGYVKIGATDKEAEKRRIELSTPPGVMFPFETYAYYETPNSLEDKTLHKIIDRINPELRVNKRREFYKMTASDAYELLEGIAEITGTKDSLIMVSDKNVEPLPVKKKKPPFSFKSAHIPSGSTISYTEDEDIKATVIGDQKKNVRYDGKSYSLSELAQLLLGYNHPVQGTLYFKYQDETLNDRRYCLEKEGKYH